MNPRRSARLAVIVTAVASGLLALLLIVGALTGQSREGEATSDLIAGVILLLAPPAISLLGATIVRRTGNVIGWMFVVMPLAAAAAIATEAYVRVGYHPPSSLRGVEAAAWLSQMAAVCVLLPIPVLLLLFPTGRPLSSRWRWAVRGWAGGAALVVLWMAFRDGEVYGTPADAYPGIDNPLAIPGLSAIQDVVIKAGIGLLLLSGLLGIVSLAVRFVRARGEERQQLRWIALVALVAGLLLLVLLADDVVDLGEGPLLDAVFFALVLVLLLGLPAAVAISVLKYRLYDIDVVIRKTVVFGLLAAFVAVVYAAIVGGLGALAGSVADTTWSFVAAAVLAVAFQPARDRARKIADRLVYGDRATPYEVLAEFSDRVSGAYAAEDVLPRMARVLAEGTGAESAIVWLRSGSTMRPAAVHPERTQVPASLPEHAVLVRHMGEELGALSVAMPPSDPLDPTKRELIEDLAAQAGLVLRNVRLIEELRASRQRLVAAQDEERRRIERNIHDGAQQQLVALTVRLRLAQGFVGQNPARAEAMLAELQAETQSALDDLRDLARGIYPPLLADKGLAAALEAQARKSPVPTTVLPDGVGRFDQDVEATVYFCVLEAMQNVAKYAEASEVTVSLSQVNGGLAFEVRDDGRGFDADATGSGTGLQGMADRLEVLRGELSVQSAPGAGTSVRGRIPGVWTS